MFDDVIAAKVAADPTWHDTRRGRSYTWGSREGIRAVIASLPPRYPMELIAHDMETLVRALAWTVETRGCESGVEACGCATCESGTLLSSIAETVGVEWV